VGLYRALAHWDVRDRCGSLAVPTRVLAGARDTLVPLSALETLAAALPGATLEVRPQGGHSPMLEHPEDFSSWLQAGLRSPRPASATFLELPGRVAAWLAAPRPGRPAVEVLPPEVPGPGLWARLVRSVRRLWAWALGRPAVPLLEEGDAANGSQPPAK